MRSPRGSPESGTPAGPGGTDLAWRAFVAAGLVAMVVFLLDPTGGFVQALIMVGLEGAAVVALIVGVRRHRPRPTGAWRLLIGASAIYWIATIGWNLYPVLMQQPLPFPSIFDPLFWAGYLGWLGFLVAVIARQSRGEAGAVVDAVIIAAAVSVLGWRVLLDPVLDSSLPAPVLVASVTYPVLLTAITAAAVRAAVAPVRVATVHVLLVGWVGLELAADVWYSLASAAGTFSYGHPWFLAWLGSFTLLGALGLHPDLPALTTPRDTGRPPRPRARLVVLTAAGLLPLVAIAGGSLDRPRTVILAGMAAVIWLAIMVRMRRSVGHLVEEQHRRTQEQHLRAQLEHVALHDGLTGLPNRLAFERELRRALTVRHAEGRSAMVLLADLDGFKAVNDTHGHEAGDELLRRIARRFTDVMRDADTVARLGGDEFAVVIDDIELTEGLALADRLSGVVAEPIDIGSAAPMIGVSVGVHFVEPGDTPDTALRHADTAMYAAKSDGGGVELFDAGHHRRFLDRYQLEVQLRAAPSADQLVLDYQPILRLEDRVVVGAEALVRWRHPERGLLHPEEFLDLAEASGAIVDIGRWVLRQACRDAAGWQDPATRPEGVWVAVNVSRRQLIGPAIVTDVADALAAAGLPAHLLTLEVTERGLTEDMDAMIAAMGQLEELGVHLAVDDFGTGYSSVADLQRMPVDILKIDGTFVAGIARTAEERAVASAIVQLATSLGHRTLAEGIEEASQLAHLRRLGCEFGQGHLLAFPMPIDELRRRHFPPLTPG